MRSFTLNGTINAKRIKDLIKRIELCKSKNINLYLCSDGGYTDMSSIFVDFTFRTRKKINFIAVGRIVSACMHIFLDAKGKKTLLPNTVGMLHVISIDPESRELRNKNSLASVLVKEMEKENAERMEAYTKIFGLSNTEIELLKNGGDLGIDYERFKKALPKIKKYKKK